MSRLRRGIGFRAPIVSATGYLHLHDHRTVATAGEYLLRWMAATSHHLGSPMHYKAVQDCLHHMTMPPVFRTRASTVVVIFVCSFMAHLLLNRLWTLNMLSHHYNEEGCTWGLIYDSQPVIIGFRNPTSHTPVSFVNRSPGHLPWRFESLFSYPSLERPGRFAKLSRVSTW